MVEKTDSQAPEETLKPGEATAVDETVPPPADAATEGPAEADQADDAQLDDQADDDQADDDQDDDQDDGRPSGHKLLRDLPLDVLHRVTGLAVNEWQVIGQTSRKRMLALRCEAEMYAIAACKPSKKDTEEVLAAMREGSDRGGFLCTHGDLIAEQRRRAAHRGGDDAQE